MNFDNMQTRFIFALQLNWVTGPELIPDSEAQRITIFHSVHSLETFSGNVGFRLFCFLHVYSGETNIFEIAGRS